MTKLAIVTGSNKGIGLATVKGLAKKLQDGWHVYLTARNEERGLNALEEVKKEGFNNVHFHQLDIDDEASIDKLRDFVKEKYGGIDILINNAAIAFKRDATESFGVQAKVINASILI